MPNNFSYNLNIPFASDSPSVDQPNMQTNTNSISSLISIDHVGFNTNGGGIHKQVTLQNEAAPGLGDGNGVLYANLLNGNSWPIWQNSLGSTALISQASSVLANGYVSLPAGVLIQWGTSTQSTGGTVTFPFNPFPTACFGVLCTVLANNNNRHFVFVKTFSTSGFTVASRDSSGNDESNTFFWVAIGN